MSVTSNTTSHGETHHILAMGSYELGLKSFKADGPEGSHSCLIYEPMREPLWIFQKRFVNQRLPLPMAKAYICILLAGLEYLQAECKVVHTDLNLDNILMALESKSVLSGFIKEHTTEISMQYKTDPITGLIIYSCHDDLGPLNAKKLGSITPKLGEFGQATWLESDTPKLEAISLHPIQPDHCFAPEVILDCGWDVSADI